MASWDEALQRIVSELTRIKVEHGPDAIAGLASSRATNEDCYAMSRLMRAAIGTNNIDNCSRVCHSPTSYALRKSFGLSGATGSFTDIDHADVAVLIGVNPTQGHPVVGARIKQAALRGCKLVTIDPRRIELADVGVAAPRPPSGHQRRGRARPGHVMRRDGLTRLGFIAERTEGYEAVRSCSRPTRPRRWRRSPGSRPTTSSRPPTSTARPSAASILWGLGVTEHKYGSEVVQLLCNLAMMTGNVGKPGSALLPLRGQNNVQGSSDMGALPDTYTAYRCVDRRGDRAALRGGLGRPAVAQKWVHDPADVRRAIAGDLKAMYIFGEDIAQTDPDTAHVDHGAGEPGVRRLPGDLRERDHQVRGRHPAGLGVLGEGRDVHQRRAALPARRGRDRSARRRADRLRHHHHGLADARSRHGLAIPVGRPGRDLAADPALPRREQGADRAQGGAVADAPRRHRLPDALRHVVRQSRRARGSSPSFPTRRPATRPTTSSRWCSSPAGCCSTTTPAR